MGNNWVVQCERYSKETKTQIVKRINDQEETELLYCGRQSVNAVQMDTCGLSFCGP